MSRKEYFSGSFFLYKTVFSDTISLFWGPLAQLDRAAPS